MSAPDKTPNSSTDLAALSQIALWQAAVDGLVQALWLVDVSNLQILHSNDAAVRLTGRSQEAMRGLAVQELAATPEDLLFWSQPVSAIAAGVYSFTHVWNEQTAQLIAVDRQVQPLLPLGTDTQQPAVLLLTMLDRTEQDNAQAELERLLSELRATLDSAVDGVLTCDLNGEVRAFNQRLAHIWQLPVDLLVRRDDAAIRAHMQAQVLDAAAYQALSERIADDPMLQTSDILRLSSGATVEQRSVPQIIQGLPAGRVFTFRDITQQAQTQAGLRLAAQVFDSSLDAIFIADEQLALVRINPACERLLRVDSSQALAGQPVVALWAGTQEQAAEQDLQRVQQAWRSEGFWRSELFLQTADGGRCPVQLSWVAVKDEQGRIQQSIGFIRDLTEQQAAQQRIDQLAHSDALTGLANRLQLAKKVQSLSQGTGTNQLQFAILFLDLDRFKIINDSLGQEFGDKVLRLVAERIQGCLRQVDLLCRLGGDEFVIYVHGADAATAEAVARRIVAEMQHPYRLDGLDFSIQASIGIALYPRDGLQLDELIQHADTAMHQVKERGRGSYSFYQPQMNADVLPRMKMEHAMRQALGLGQMAVYFQPQVDVASGRIYGAEALLRWRDPELGMVSPGLFIPLAEESGYILTLGAWVLDQSVQQAKRWQQAAREVVVSVNVSALQFQQADFVDLVTQVLVRHELPPHLLELELTESILLQDAVEMSRLLAALAALGVGLAIDDFGTGYSSLAYLKKLEIDRLKIDQSFVRGLPADQGDLAIVRAIISMGQALGLGVIAEGVETPEQCQVLHELGCESYQGFLCSPALEAGAFWSLLQTMDAQAQR